MINTIIMKENITFGTYKEFVCFFLDYLDIQDGYRFMLDYLL